MRTGVRVLVVDDSPFIHKIVNRELKVKGMEIVGHAYDGRQCLRMVEELAPDIVLLDVVMPVLNGLETARQLRSEHPGVRVIMVSTLGDRELLDEVRQIGVRHFIIKPMTRVKMVEAILKSLNDKTDEELSVYSGK
ncbi:MAG: response regulator [Synergistales bacterium]|nr:response regulator [Synergistales bacterium]